MRSVMLTGIMKVNDRECQTEIQTSYTTTLETQCSPGYGTKVTLTSENELHTNKCIAVQAELQDGLQKVLHDCPGHRVQGEH